MKLQSQAGFWVVIPAAGSGQRYASIPKQWTEINQKFVLVHTLERFLNHGQCLGVVVVLDATIDRIPNQQRQALDGLINQYPSQIHFEIGSNTRAGSVLKGLRYLVNLSQAEPTQWVMVHDAARPCLHPEDLQRIYAKLSDSDDASGFVLGQPVTDSLKRVEQPSDQSPVQVAAIVDRSNLWAAQTPQVFRLGELTNAILNARHKDIDPTDESQAMLVSGGSTTMIEAKYPNPKLTYARDRDYVAFLLSNLNQLDS